MANNKNGNTGRTSKKSTHSKKSSKEPIPIDGGITTQTSSTPIHSESMPDAQSIAEEIRARAYEIYEQHGCQDGLHQEDWTQAESEILEKYRKKEKSA
jgi:hypothetical protein